MPVELPRVFRGEDDRRDIGEPSAVAIAEVVQVEDDGRAGRACPTHQLQADGVSAVGQQGLGPEPFEDLLGEVEEHGALVRGGRPVGPAGGRGQHGDADAADLQVDHLRVPPRPSDASRRRAEPSRPRLASNSSTVVSRW